MRIEVCKRLFDVCLWRPGQPVLQAKHLALDTETERLVSGAPIKPVLLQVASGDGVVHLVWHTEIPQYLEQLRQARRDVGWYMHNAPFDCDVLGLLGTDELRQRIDERLLVDTSVRFILHRLSKGEEASKYNLAYASRTILNYEMAKDEEVRLAFKQDMVGDLEAFGHWIAAGCPETVDPQWSMTTAQVRYAATDPIATLLLGELLDPNLPTEDVQLRGYFGLHWISHNGFQVDAEYRDVLKDMFQKRMTENADILSVYGYYPGQTGSNTVLQDIMAVFERQLGVSFARTEKTQRIQINDGAEDILEASNRPLPIFLTAYRDYRHSEKMLSTYLNPELVGVDGRVHPYFAPLMRTGRTSCSRPNIQNIPRAENIRGIYVAAPGHVLFVCDYSQIELCALAQSCLHWYKHSRMAEVINGGQDVHSWFGNIIKENDRRPEAAKTKVDYRQLAETLASINGVNSVKTTIAWERPRATLSQAVPATTRERKVQRLAGDLSHGINPPRAPRTRKGDEIVWTACRYHEPQNIGIKSPMDNIEGSQFRLPRRLGPGQAGSLRPQQLWCGDHRGRSGAAEAPLAGSVPRNEGASATPGGSRLRRRAEVVRCRDHQRTLCQKVHIQRLLQLQISGPSR
jgi:hypothetical protein